MSIMVTYNIEGRKMSNTMKVLRGQWRINTVLLYIID